MRKRVYKTCMYCTVLGGEVFGGMVPILRKRERGGIYRE